MRFGARQAMAAMVGIAISITTAGATPASAQLFWKTPDFTGAPVKGDEPGVMIPLTGATPAELNAEIVWTMRAGLNFAALQCQFAPSLMTVPTYNALIGHHSKELATDYKTLQTYFKRVAKKGTSPSAVAAAFDSFNTRTYSSFSSVFAQMGFCQTASCRPPICSTRRSRRRNSPASTCRRCRRPASIAPVRSRRSACRPANGGLDLEPLSSRLSLG